jgi:hypothetical protein
VHRRRAMMKSSNKGIKYDGVFHLVRDILDTGMLIIREKSSYLGSLEMLH